MIDRDVVIIDLETTGIFESRAEFKAPHQPRIIQVGAVKIPLAVAVECEWDFFKIARGGTSLKAFHHSVNPGIDTQYDPEAMRVNKLNPDNLTGCCHFGIIGKDLGDFVGDAICAAFPISYELPLLQMEYARYNIPCPIDRRMLDIGTMSRIAMWTNGTALKVANPGKPANYSMVNVMNSIGMPPTKTHDALQDALQEAEILCWSMKVFKYIESGVREINKKLNDLATMTQEAVEAIHYRPSVEGVNMNPIYLIAHGQKRLVTSRGDILDLLRITEGKVFYKFLQNTNESCATVEGWMKMMEGGATLP